MSNRSADFRPCLLAGVAIWLLALTAHAAPSGAEGDFSAFLPPPLGPEWQRGEVRSGPADAERFGGGISTSARYTRGSESCVITITGESPMMRGVSMTFSNPAVAGMTGGQMVQVGDEPVLITESGDIQALASNFLIEYLGDCTRESRLAYVALTDIAGLRSRLAPRRSAAGAAPVPPGAGVVWERTVGGPDNDWAYAMTATRDGGVAVAGRQESAAGREDLWVVRLDAEGEVLWQRNWGGAAIDRARAIIELDDGRLAVAGATSSKGAGDYDVWILLLDAQGELLRDQTFGSPATEWASGLVQMPDGGLAVAAYAQPAPGQPFDFWVLRLDGAGELLWQRSFGGEAIDWASALAATPEGGLVVVGHTESHGPGQSAKWVLRLDPAGELEWAQSFGGPGRDYAATVMVNRAGEILVGGPMEVGAGVVDSRLIKLMPDGSVIWDRTFGGVKDDWVRSLLETQDGHYAVAGYTMSQGAGLYDAWLLLLDQQGELVAERTFGGPANDWARAVVELPDGDLVLAGDTWSQGAGESDMWVFRVHRASLR